MLQLYPVFLLCDRHKTLTGSPDPTFMQPANNPCIGQKPITWQDFFQKLHENKIKQDCIPVGCVLPACCPYLPALTAPGGRGVPVGGIGYLHGGMYLPRGDVPAQGRCTCPGVVSAPGPWRGTCLGGVPAGGDLARYSPL